MKAKWTVTMAIAALALAVTGGLALAQRRDMPMRPGGMGPGMQHPGTGPRQGADPGAGLGWLMAEADEVEVTDTDDGVRVNVVVRDPATRERIQNRVRRAVDGLNVMAEHAAERGAPAPQMMQGVMPLLISGQIVLGARSTDDGVSVTFSSENPQIVRRLQQALPQLAERVRQRGGNEQDDRTPAMQHAREAMELLAQDSVDIEVDQVAGGISVSITSTDPEVAKAIQKDLTAYFNHAKQRARMMQRMQERMREREGGRGRQEGRGRMWQQGRPMQSPHQGPRHW